MKVFLHSTYDDNYQGHELSLLNNKNELIKITCRDLIKILCLQIEDRLPSFLYEKDKTVGFAKTIELSPLYSNSDYIINKSDSFFNNEFFNLGVSFSLHLSEYNCSISSSLDLRTKLSDSLCSISRMKLYSDEPKIHDSISHWNSLWLGTRWKGDLVGLILGPTQRKYAIDRIANNIISGSLCNSVCDFIFKVSEIQCRDSSKYTQAV